MQRNNIRFPKRQIGYGGKAGKKQPERRNATRRLPGYFPVLY
jgi:hypothetical protein